MTTEPSGVRAVIVGISTFAMGKGWRLPKAAENAVELAKWLIAKKVPPKNIDLFLSEADKDRLQGGLDPRIQIRRATQASFTDFLDNELPNLSADLLYFYWSGHGNINDVDGEILFFEDWKDGQHHRHLDLDNLQQRLRRAPYGAKFPEQVAWVDACANQFEELEFSGTTGRTLFSLEQPLVSGVRQCCYLAAAPLQQAAAGLFSSEILAGLQGSVDFPPDQDKIFETVREKLEDSDQTPIRLAWQSRAGDSGVLLGFSGDFPGSAFVNSVADTRGVSVRQLRSLANIAASYPVLAEFAARDQLYGGLAGLAGVAPGERPSRRSFRSDLLRIVAFAFYNQSEAHLVQELRKVVPDAAEFEAGFARSQMLRETRQALMNLAKPMEVLRQIYRVVTGRLSKEPKRVEARTLGEMLDELSQGTAGEDGYLPLFEFLLRLRAAVDPLGAELEALVNKYAKPVDIQTICAMLAGERHLHLHICVEPAENCEEEQGLSEVRGVLFVSGSALALRDWTRKAQQWSPDAEQAIKEIVLDARRVVKDELKQKVESMDVDLLVSPPFFNQAADQIVVQKSYGFKRSLGQLHPVVLRWRERILEDMGRESWCAYGRQLQPKRTQAPEANWVQECGQLKQCGGVAVLEFSPTDEQGFEKLCEAVFAGFPFIAWLRRPPADWDQVKEACKRWTQAAAQLQEVPRKLREVRAAQDDSELRDHLNLLWDDPDNIFEWKHTDSRMKGDK